MRRTERVADTIREEIAQIVGYELEDPRLTMVTVTDVRLSGDKRCVGAMIEIHKPLLSFCSMLSSFCSIL